MKYFQTKARNFPTQAQSFEQPKKVLCYTIYPEIFRSLKVCYPEKYAFISLWGGALLAHLMDYPQI